MKHFKLIKFGVLSHTIFSSLFSGSLSTCIIIYFHIVWLLTFFKSFKSQSMGKTQLGIEGWGVTGSKLYSWQLSWICVLYLRSGIPAAGNSSASLRYPGDFLMSGIGICCWTACDMLALCFSIPH